MPHVDGLREKNGELAVHNPRRPAMVIRDCGDPGADSDDGCFQRPAKKMMTFNRVTSPKLVSGLKGDTPDPYHEPVRTDAPGKYPPQETGCEKTTALTKEGGLFIF